MKSGVAGALPVGPQPSPLAIMKSEYIRKARTDGRRDRMEIPIL